MSMGLVEENHQRIEEALSRALYDRQLFPDEPGIAPARSFAAGRGKRLRPQLCLLAYQAAKGAQGRPQTVLDAAVGLELLHAYLLVHDDLVDHATTRRGEPALHLRYDRDGESFALIAGDWLHTVAWGLLLRAQNLRVADEVQRMLEEVTLGELLDMRLGAERIDAIGREEILRMMRLKTACYTCIGPLRIGCALADADDTLLGLLSEVGERLGIAYQISDDELGLFGDERRIGKSTLSDLHEGKKTLFIHEAYARLDRAGRERLTALWGSSDAGARELERVRLLITRCGAREAVREEASQLIRNARDLLAQAQIRAWAREALLSLVERLERRTA